MILVRAFALKMKAGVNAVTAKSWAEKANCLACPRLLDIIALSNFDYVFVMVRDSDCSLSANSKLFPDKILLTGCVRMQASASPVSALAQRLAVGTELGLPPGHHADAKAVG